MIANKNIRTNNTKLHKDIKHSPADIEPTKVSRNLTITMKKFSPDDAWLLTRDIVLHRRTLAD